MPQWARDAHRKAAPEASRPAWCQQAHNLPPEEEEAAPAAPESLWHEMQLRERATAETATAADVDYSMRASGFLGGDNWGFDDIGGSLFAEATEPVWTAPSAVPASPPMAVAAGSPALPAHLGGGAGKAAKAAAARQLGLGAGGAAEATLAQRTKGGAAPGREATIAAAAAPSVATETTAAGQPAPEASKAAAAAEAAEAAEEAGPAAAEPSAAAAAEHLAAVGRTSSGLPTPFSAAGGGAGGQEGASRALALADPATNAASISRMNSMLTAVKQSISAVGKAVLPRLLRKQLDGERLQAGTGH